MGFVMGAAPMARKMKVARQEADCKEPPENGRDHGADEERGEKFSCTLNIQVVAEGLALIICRNCVRLILCVSSTRRLRCRARLARDSNSS